MTRKTQFALGASIAGALLLVLPTIAWFETGDIRWAGKVAVGVVVGALGVFFRALNAPAAARVAHQSCAECRRTILFEHEGELCEQCGAPFHATCQGAHKTSAHATPPLR